MSLSLYRDDLIRTHNFIGGRWVTSTSVTFSVRDPADDDMISEIADNDGKVAKAAIDAAHEVYCREGSRYGLVDYMDIKCRCQGGLS